MSLDNILLIPGLGGGITPPALPTYAQMIDILPTSSEQYTLIDGMESGTGWSNAWGSWTDEYGFGAQFVEATANRTITKIYASDFSTYQYLTIRVWIEDIAKLGHLRIFMYDSVGTLLAGQTLLSQAEKPIVNGVNDLVIRRGDWSFSNVREIRFRVDPVFGQTARVAIGKVQAADLRPLCSIWIDDGAISAYDEAIPRMSAKGWAGSMAVVSRASRGVSTAGLSETAMSTSQLLEIKASGWDLSNHTADHERLSEITAPQIDATVKECMNYLLNDLGMSASNGAFHFAYPFGGTNRTETSLPIVQKYSHLDRITGNSHRSRIPVTFSGVALREVLASTTEATVQGWIDTAISEQRWLILLFHQFRETSVRDIDWKPSYFQNMLNYLEAESASIDVVTPSEAIRRMAPGIAP